MRCSRERRKAEEAAAVDPEEQQQLLEALEGTSEDEDRLIEKARARRQVCACQSGQQCCSLVGWLVI